MLSHVLFISKSNSENCIKIRLFLAKLQTKISWLLFYGQRCSIWLKMLVSLSLCMSVSFS